MKIDIKQIQEGEESIQIRYRAPNPIVSKIIDVLNGEDTRLWGRVDDKNISVTLDDILYLESVDARVFVYTKEQVVRIDGSLNSFMAQIVDERFFRCSKSMVININRILTLKSLSSNRIDATLENGEHIIISRRYASEFRRILKGER